MSRFRRLLMSVAVTVMITDLVLIALACVPSTAIKVADESIAIQSTTNSNVLHAGRGGEHALGQPAFWGKIWKAVKRIGACIGCGITSYEPWCRYCRDGQKSLYRNER